MRLRPALPLIALTLVACGGGSSHSGSNQGLTATHAAAVTSAVVGSESTAQASATTLPLWSPVGEGNPQAALGLQLPSMGLPDCATVTTTGPDAQGFTHQTWTFAHCVSGDESLDGSIDLVWKAGDYSITFNHLVKSEDGGAETTSLDGTRHVVIDTASQTGTVTLSNFTLAHTEASEPEENHTFTYSASYLTDWATAGQFKLWGTFTAQANADPAVNGTIDAATPLTWTQGCCRPTSGTLHLEKAGQSADVVFSLPCGTITVTVAGQSSVTRKLRGCH
ncbi:MAG TPA: hypothetical protein VJ623_02505 [Holophagaceae bacterium]|nr:hypothetical protein [Holophagaceae bacterium]